MPEEGPDFSLERMTELIAEVHRSKERKLLAEWLEKQSIETRTQEELVGLLVNMIECLKRGVFPD